MANRTLHRLQRLWVRRTLALALFAGLAVAGYLAFSVWDRVGALGSAHQDHAEWVYSQLETDFLKLERALDDARSGTAVELTNLRKRFDIFYSRTQVAARVQGVSELSAETERLRRVLDAQIAIIDSPDAQLFSRLSELQFALQTIERLPRQIGLASISFAAAASEAEREQIVQLIEMLLLLALIVISALIAMTIRLSRQALVLNRTSRAAEENHLRLATTLRASLDAVVVVSDGGEILDFNGSAETIFGITRNTALGKNFIDLLIPPKSGTQQSLNLETFREIGRGRVTGTSRHEFEMTNDEGHIFPVEISVSLTRSDDAPVFVTYIRDITDEREKEEEIIRARDDALVAYREKSRFFAMMSHEMRTPLNGVLSAIHLLNDGRLDGEQQRFIDAALTSGDILLGHIDDVLAIERSEADTSDLELQACNISALAIGILETMKPLAKMSGTRLHLKQSGVNDRLILTDPRAIQQILVNLVSNAIKFGPDDDITLNVSYQESSNEDAILQLQVSDNGPGISQSDIQRIFEDYVSLDSRYERHTGGTGLGLGIVRRLVLRLGGDVTCHSEPSQGTRFVVRLPVTTIVPEKAHTPALRDPNPRQLTPMKLLAVDDNEINRDLIKAMLQRLGHTVTLASGGQEAITVATNNRFDAILMDISMPGVNGLQATKAILAGGGPNAETPIMAVTAHALLKEREEFAAAGMRGFLQKPLNTKKLNNALEALVLATHDGAPHIDQPIAKDSKAPVPLLNENQVSELFEVLGHATLTDRIATLAARIEGALPELMKTHETGTLQAKAHDMAGVSGMFGAVRLHRQLRDIETDCKNGDISRALERVKDIPNIWNNTHSAWHSRLADNQADIAR